MRVGGFLALTIGLCCAVPYAQEWTMYRGANTDGISTEAVNLKFPAAGPKTLWKAPTENGFSSFAIGGGKVFTLVGRKIENTPSEVCIALDEATGKEAWAVPLDSVKYEGGGASGAPGNVGGDGPRSTPAFSDGIVYSYTGNMILEALDASTGKKVWAQDIKKDFAGHNIQWECALSPVIDGELIFVAGGGPGESILAFNKKTGAVAWKAHNEIMTHSSPTIATILGEKQVIFFLQSGLLAVSPKDGKALWKFPYRYSTSTAISPVVCGDVVYCSAGYGVGGGACKISKQGDAFKATPLWQTPGNAAVANHWSTPVCKDGYLYGMFSFKAYSTGPMKCVEAATGKVMWEQPGFGAGNVIMVNNQLLALSDNGTLITVEASPTAYKEISRAKVIDGKCWSTPALSDGHIFVRSTKEAACVDVSGK